MEYRVVHYTEAEQVERNKLNHRHEIFSQEIQTITGRLISLPRRSYRTAEQKRKADNDGRRYDVAQEALRQIDRDLTVIWEAAMIRADDATI